MWDSLPEECRRLKFNNANLPEMYLGNFMLKRTGEGGRWITTAVLLEGLPDAMGKELAWWIHREVQIGRLISVDSVGCMSRVLRAATQDGTERGRTSPSVLSLAPDEWLREAQAARLKGRDLGRGNDANAVYYLRRAQELLSHAYHVGEWWQLDLWNPLLDPRIPVREHEPGAGSRVNFSHLTSAWLREGTKWWLGAGLESGRYSWGTLKTRVDGMKWLQRHINSWGDRGPLLVDDPAEWRPYFRTFAEGMRTHAALTGPNKGKPLGKVTRRQTIVTIEQFYRWMYDNRFEAAEVLGDPRWRDLRPEHTVPFRLEDKPRLTNAPKEGMVLEDAVLSKIAEGSELLARPVEEGGMGDLQAFHALALLLRTGRRINEILMLDFDPLRPLLRADAPPVPGPAAEDAATATSGELVARLRYQQTKVRTGDPTIPVDDEIVRIIRAQQAHARAIMKGFGYDGDPKYLFPGTKLNRSGGRFYAAQTLHVRLGELSRRLDIRDSVGAPVSISQTHKFRHTKATNLLNAGVPIHVVMRYFGHVTPTMTMHYAQTLSTTAEQEFLRYKKLTVDGRELGLDPADLYDVLHLDQRADRILPNGWCMLPPKKSCDRGNACLSCSMWTTDASHRPELEKQLAATVQLVAARQEGFLGKFGVPMPDDNIWLATRRREEASLRQVLTTLDEIQRRGDSSGAVRGAGADLQSDPHVVGH
ncbi:tyrosine-type recombinase/integrase [Nocardioides baekrokdamisoli]|uniref:tyrosine-type recombinase/integrase n=1 Tax=Nocardioides baekrokdamisoli TaxID=1804624 RepID=UPI000F7757D1|nr:tyrosine-type recombinase/integrase [Nocardioides baekrokdamisoli]